MTPEEREKEYQRNCITLILLTVTSIIFAMLFGGALLVLSKFLNQYP